MSCCRSRVPCLRGTRRIGGDNLAGQKLSTELLGSILEATPGQACVLCCGDSLTAGYYGSNDQFAPWASVLTERLGVPVDEIGMVSWSANRMLAEMNNPQNVDYCGKIKRGLQSQLLVRPYTVCIIMAGTNDLRDHFAADKILDTLKGLHTTCHAHGLRTVALPILPNRFLLQQDPAGNKTRLEANLLLQEWAETMGDRVLFIDMAAQFPFSDGSEYWLGDGLHMTPKGYRSFGELLSEKLGHFVSSSGPGPSK